MMTTTKTDEPTSTSEPSKAEVIEQVNAASGTDDRYADLPYRDAAEGRAPLEPLVHAGNSESIAGNPEPLTPSQPVVTPSHSAVQMVLEVGANLEMTKQLVDTFAVLVDQVRRDHQNDTLRAIAQIQAKSDEEISIFVHAFAGYVMAAKGLTELRVPATGDFFKQHKVNVELVGDEFVYTLAKDTLQ